MMRAFVCFYLFLFYVCKGQVGNENTPPRALSVTPNGVDESYYADDGDYIYDSAQENQPKPEPKAKPKPKPKANAEVNPDPKPKANPQPKVVPQELVAVVVPVAEGVIVSEDLPPFNGGIVGVLITLFTSFISGTYTIQQIALIGIFALILLYIILLLWKIFVNNGRRNDKDDDDNEDNEDNVNGDGSNNFGRRSGSRNILSSRGDRAGDRGQLGGGGGADDLLDSGFDDEVQVVSSDVRILLHQAHYCYQLSLSDKTGELSERLTIVIDLLSQISKFSNIPEATLAVLQPALHRLSKVLVESTSILESDKKTSNMFAFLFSSRNDRKRDIISRINIAFHDLNSSFNGIDRKELVNSTLEQVAIILNIQTVDFAVQQQLQSYNYQPGSRVWLHAHVDRWLRSESRHNYCDVCWLNAGIGMGKSAFTANLVDVLQRRSHNYNCLLLGAVFIKFNDAKLSNPVNVLKSIVYQIVQKFQRWIDFVLRTIEKLNDCDSVTMYWEYLLIPLLNDIKDQLDGEYLLIVIDGLDEVGVEGSDRRKDFLGLFSVKYLSRISKEVRFFVTGRPEVDVKKHLLEYSLTIDDDDERHIDDIRSFILFNLEQVFVDRLDIIEALATPLLKKSENNFQFIALILQQVPMLSSDNVQFSVDRFMSKINWLPEGIDSNYKKTLVKLSSAVRTDKWREVLQLMVYSAEPLSESELRYFLTMEHKNEESEFRRLVDHLATVFSLRIINQNGKQVRRFYPFHKSIIDWFKNSDRSCEFYCSAEKSNMLFVSRMLNKIELSANDSMNAIKFTNTDYDILEMSTMDLDIERYLFKHLILHVDRCSDFRLNYIVNHLLTSLPWIQSVLNQLGPEWLAQLYYDRIVLSNLTTKTDFKVMHQFLLSLLQLSKYNGNIQWHREIPAHIYSRLDYRAGSSSIEKLHSDSHEYIKSQGGWLIERSSILENFSLNNGIELITKCKKPVECIHSNQNYLVVGQLDGNIQLINVSSGSDISFPVDGDIVSVLLMNNKLYCGSSKGVVYRIDYTSGEVELEYNFAFPQIEVHSFPNGTIGCFSKFEHSLIICDSYLFPLNVYKCLAFENICILLDNYVLVIDNSVFALELWNLESGVVSPVIFEEKILVMKTIKDGEVVILSPSSIIIASVKSDLLEISATIEISDCDDDSLLCVCSDNSLIFTNKNIIKWFVDLELVRVFLLEFDILLATSLLDGRFAFYSDVNREVVIWNPKTHQDSKLETKSNIRILCLLSDGRLVTLKNNKCIQVLNYDNETIDWSMDGDFDISHAFGLKNKQLVTISSECVDIWSILRTKPIVTVSLVYVGSVVYATLVQNVLIIRGTTKSQLQNIYLNVETMSFQEFDFDDNCHIVCSLSFDEVVFNMNNACYIYTISLKSTCLIFDRPTDCACYYDNEKYILLMFHHNGFVLLDSKTFSVVKGLNIDWNKFPSNLKFPAFHQELLSSSRVEYGIRFPNNNKFAFETEDQDLGFATFYSPNKV